MEILITFISKVKSLEGLEKLDDLLFDGEMKEDITTAKGGRR